ncbi:endo-1,4-beta-xylanase [Rhodopirellula sp. JC740]|uniref:endo-1,4-beta-xylanase n=1 Tax=Rhodopirellula halodulae TaxID=2894198 RepID=A0ABS8NLD7_9BACT|nr:endo-1,4-beta-xylanase [Rhodopirellula sp. JC740]MCC9643762.1 endo-1,4-beta-xylanase [Rhodopirellula sp. JC740]
MNREQATFVGCAAVSLLAIALSFSLVLASCAFAQTPNATNPDQPATGTTIVPMAGFRLDVRPGAGGLEGNGNRIVVDSPVAQEEAWALQIQCPPIDATVAKEDAFCVSFDARALPPTDGNGTLHVSMAVNDPWDAIDEKNGFRTFDVPPTWHPFRVCFRSKQAYTAERVYASIQCAAKAQRIEIRDLQLIAFGNVSDSSLPVTKLLYPGENEDAWRAEAERSIERHRKRNLTVRVIDATGKPIPNARVRIQQLRHAYAFGTFVGDTPIQAGEDAEKFRQQTTRWFNRVTVPRYWADWGTDRPSGVVRADSIAQWASEEELELKTHVLLYPQFIPDRVKQLSNQPTRFREELESAMDSALERTSEIPIAVWDGLNELRDVSLVGDVLGEDYYADVFRLGQKAQPNARWFINEYGLMTGGVKRDEFLQTYLKQIQSILDRSGPIEGIGLQCHFQSDLISMPDAWKVLNELSRFQLPIEITEFDVDTRDEATQAQFTRDFLTLVFAHPVTTGFTTWGFWEGDMWRPNGAMIRADWSLKPNAAIWEEMIFDKWWTDQTIQTGNDGTAMARVFLGTHRVEAETQNLVRFQTIHVDSDDTVTLQIGVDHE